MTKAPTICIDGFNLAMPHGSGIATYGHTLLEAIKGLGGQGQVLYGPRDGLSASSKVSEATIISGQSAARKAGMKRAISTWTSRFGVPAYAVPASGAIHWPRAGMREPAAASYWMSRELFHLGRRAFEQYGTITPVDFKLSHDAALPDVMHWTCPLPLRANGIPNVLTIHDIIPLTLPHSTKEQKGRYHQLVDRACQSADHIFCVSETTKRDLVGFFHIPDDKITVTYQPVLKPEPFDAADDENWLSDALKLERHNYFLFYGAIEPKKNLGRIVEAYLESRTQTPLVIVGGRQWLEDYERGLLDAYLAANPEGRIVMLDFLPRSSLERLIRGAKATLFPSLYEGFGLPILEAMAQGSPVLTSNFGAMAEIAGDAACLVDPYDVKAITEGLRALDHDADYRDALTARGSNRAADFSPDAYEARLKSAYAKVGIGL